MSVNPTRRAHSGSFAGKPLIRTALSRRKAVPDHLRGAGRREREKVLVLRLRTKVSQELGHIGYDHRRD